MMMNESWAWHELQLKDVGQFKSFDQLSQKFRRRNAVGLITRLEALKGFVALNLLAPRNAAFWGVGSVIGMMRFYKHLETNGLQHDAATKKLFLRDLRKASVKLSDPSINFFSQYENFFPTRSGRTPGFGENGTLAGYYRYLSLASTETTLPRLIAHLEFQAEQFGELGFFAVDDCISLDPGHYIDHTAYQCLFHRWTLPGYDEKRRKAWFQELKSEIEYQLERVVVGDNLNVPLSPTDFIRPGVSFYLSDKKTTPHDEIGDPICRTIISIRARLVRELAWPSFYGDVCQTLAPGEYEEPRRIDTYGRLEPYDVVAELEQYKRDMEQRYPCLLEDPLNNHP